MNNVIYLNNDPIIIELSNAVDNVLTKKMLAYKYFNNNENLLMNIYFKIILKRRKR